MFLDSPNEISWIVFLEDESHPLRAKTSDPFPSKILTYSLRDKMKYLCHYLLTTSNVQISVKMKNATPANASAPIVDRRGGQWSRAFVRSFIKNVNKLYVTLDRFVRKPVDANKRLSRNIFEKSGFRPISSSPTCQFVFLSCGVITAYVEETICKHTSFN